jgi:hypothetical protein
MQKTTFAFNLSKQGLPVFESQPAKNRKLSFIFSAL